MQADNENVQEQAPTDPQTRYLGDGVYASYDGQHIVLDLRGQDSFTRIVLELSVLQSLLTYAKGVYGERVYKALVSIP